MERPVEKYNNTICEMIKHENEIRNRGLETKFYENGDIDAARKAIEIFERLLRRGGFDFLKARIEQLKRNAGLSL